MKATTTKTTKPSGDNHGGYDIRCAERRCHKPAKYYEPEVSIYAFDSGRVSVIGPNRIDWMYLMDLDGRYELRQRITLPGLRDNAVAYADNPWRWVCGVHARVAKIVRRSEERRAADALLDAQKAARAEREAADAVVLAKAKTVRTAEQAVLTAATGLYADPPTATAADLRAAVDALETARAAQKGE